LIDASAIFTWPVLVAQLTMFGTAWFALLFARERLRATSGLSPRIVTMWRTLAAVDLVMSPLVFLEMASGMAQTTWARTMPLVPEIMRETLAGSIWKWRFAAVATLAILSWIPMREIFATSAVAALSAILILLGTLTSHAIDRSAMVIAIYSIHQAGVGLWLGALVSLLMSALGEPGALATLAPRVSTVCACAIAIIITSGALTAFQWLGWNVNLLFYSAYGRTLMWKLAVATPALLLGVFNRYSILPVVAQAKARTLLIRTVAAECFLLLTVLGWSAILANTPPPH
jgi:putative copper export protein